MTPDERSRVLESLNPDEAELVLDSWEFRARDEQLAPAGLWRIWLFLGGRGAGKTRAGAEWILDGVWRGAMRRIALLGATYDDVRDVMIRGDSGLLACGASSGLRYESSKRQIIWPDGATAHVFTAEQPDGLRGHQFDGAWADEFCKWHEPQAALDMLLMGLRIGDDPRLVITTTPRNIASLKTLMASPGVVLTRATTFANADNLAPAFLEHMNSQYAGTRLGRQELNAELIEDNEGALWRRDWIEGTRIREAPSLARIVVAVDPPASDGANADACGIVVAGRSDEGDGYIIADRSAHGLSPFGWATRVADAYDTFDADAIVAEANQGGAMVEAVLRQAAPNAAIKLVHASRGKRARAEPAAALYERRLIHHAGVFPELEDQLCQYDGTGDSPDRMDALVWALADLFPTRGPGSPRIRRL